MARRDRRDSGDLLLGAVLSDLARGFAAVNSAVAAAGAMLRVRVSEALHDDGDALVHLRPSRPAAS